MLGVSPSWKEDSKYHEHDKKAIKESLKFLGLFRLKKSNERKGYTKSCKDIKEE